jgi:hypothetical protein
MPRINIPRSQKLDFFYFLIFTILVIIIFTVIIIGTYYDYWQRVFKIEQYYKVQSGQQ